MMSTHVTAADVQDGLDLLMVVDNPIATLAVFECLAQVPQELAIAVWASLPDQRKEELRKVA